MKHNKQPHWIKSFSKNILKVQSKSFSDDGIVMTRKINEKTDTRESVTLETLDGSEFEKLCARIFEKLHYGRVEDVQDTGDMGRDLLIHTDKGLVVVECKHHPHGSMGRPVVQKLHSAAISSKAIKGILITTGKFSIQAIEHAKTLTPPIQLIDRNILVDLASRAGVDLSFEGKKYLVYTYPVSPIDKLQTRLNRFIAPRFKSHPKETFGLLGVKSREITMHASYIVQYELDATFETSVGVIHNEKVKDGTIAIDGIDGKMLKEEIAKHLRSANLLSYNKSDYRDSILKKESFHIDANTLKKLSKEYITNVHTKAVSYWGQNNRKYTKLCVPRERDIFVSDIKQVYIPFQQVNLQALKEKYDMIAVENPENLLCYTKMFSCAICGGYIRGNGILCNSCGAIVHDKSILDSHSFECKMCGKTLCRKCAYNLGFRKKVCRECALESGRDLKPTSMKMNQHTKLGAIFIIGGGIGFLIHVALTPLLAIIGVGVISSKNRKANTKAPPYELV